MDDRDPAHRRNFLHAAAVFSAGLAASGCASRTAAPEDRYSRPRPVEAGHGDAGGEVEVPAAEDLMREHGVLKRVLLVYGEAIRRLDGDYDLPPGALADAAGIIRTFIEDYHEKLEEEHLFPRFRRHHIHVELVDTLEAQHQAGRRVTDQTLALANLRSIRDPEERRRLSTSLRAFVRMYEPHEAREDTVLFPALHRIVTPHEYGAMGEEFEKLEHRKFGQDGFETMVARVAAIETDLGIYNLAQFTPRSSTS